MSSTDRGSSAVSARAAGDGPRAHDPARWTRVKELFVAALDLPDGSRRSYLERECAGDPDLLAEIESLLRSDSAASSFCETPAARLLDASSDAAEPRRGGLASGSRLGAFQITGFIAAGGMGEVYRARDTVLDREVAIKVVRGTSGDHKAQRRLIREARHASRLAHPGICGIHEVGEADGLPFIVMELVQGRPLHDLLRDGALPPATTVDIGRQIAAALEHAHERGIVHRDLKSSNIMVDAAGMAVVLDFGLSTSVVAQGGPFQHESLTAPGVMAGTISHMAPEVLRGGPADQRSDVWSLGVVLYEMATGELPFTGRTAFETTSAILDRPPQPLSPAVPAALRAVIARCLAKDPDRRYQHARDAGDALAAAARRPRWPALAGLRESLGRPIARVAIPALAALLAAAWMYRELVRRNAAPAHDSAVVVLPFANATGARDDDYYADGITDAIASELARTRGVHVLSRGPPAREAGAPTTAAGAAAVSGAELVVQGEVHRTATAVSIDVRVVRAPMGDTVWTQRYAGAPREVLVLQANVLRGLSEALRRTPGAAAPPPRAIRAVNPEAYEEYLKGRYAWNQRTSRSLASAIEHFDRALRLDSTYAPAHAALADCYNQLGTVMVGSGSPASYRPRAEAEAIRALQIDPSLAQAHAALGYAWHYQWRWDDAERELRRAIALDPAAPLPHLWYANLLMSRLRMRDALAQATIARELDPFSLIVNTNLGWVLDRAGRHDDAIAQFTRTLALDSSYAQARGRLAAALLAAGRIDDALREGGRVVAMTDSAAPTVASLAVIEARAGHAPTARRLLDRLLTRQRTRYVPPASIATAYAALGDRDRAFAWLERAFDERSNAIAYLLGEPYDAAFKADPRYASLLARAGLAR